MEYKGWNFIPKYLEKICLVNFIIFLGTIKIWIIIDNYIWIYCHLHGNFIPTLFFGKNFLFPYKILGIKFSKLVANIGIYISIILFSGINKYNLKQTQVSTVTLVFFSSFHVFWTYFMLCLLSWLYATFCKCIVHTLVLFFRLAYSF